MKKSCYWAPKDPAEVTRYFYTPVANDILRVPGESL